MWRSYGLSDFQQTTCEHALAVLVSGGTTAPAATLGYVQTNLTSDIPGLAANTDPLLKNPWGVSFGATSPFWVSDQMTDVATL